jgi:hypothetical protein
MAFCVSITLCFNLIVFQPPADSITSCFPCVSVTLHVEDIVFGSSLGSFPLQTEADKRTTQGTVLAAELAAWPSPLSPSQGEAQAAASHAVCLEASQVAPPKTSLPGMTQK